MDGLARIVGILDRERHVATIVSFGLHFDAKWYGIRLDVQWGFCSIRPPSSSIDLLPGQVLSRDCEDIDVESEPWDGCYSTSRGVNTLRASDLESAAQNHGALVDRVMPLKEFGPRMIGV